MLHNQLYLNKLLPSFPKLSISPKEKKLYNTLPIGIVLINSHGIILFANKKTKAFFGNKHLIGLPFILLFSKDKQTSLSLYIKKTFAQKKTYSTLLSFTNGEKQSIKITFSLLQEQKMPQAPILIISIENSHNEIPSQPAMLPEERYKNLFENTQIGVYRTTPEGKVLMANPTMLHLLQYNSFEEFATSNLDQDFAPTYSRKTFKKLLEKYGEVKGLESAWVRKDKSIIYVRENAKVIKDISGKILYYEGTVEDITDKKKTEEALKYSEEQYRNLFEHAPIGIYRSTPDGKILMANPRLLQMLRFSTFKELTAHNLEADAIGPLYQRKIFKDMLEIEEEIKGLEFTWIRKDKSIIYVRENAKAIRNANGRILYYEGTVEDITEQKTVAEALKTTEEKYKNLFENIPIGLYHTTPDGRTLMANQKMIEMLECASFEELTAHNLSEKGFGPTYSRSKFKKRIKQENEIRGLEGIWITKNKARIHVRENVKAVRDNNKEIMYYEGSAENITQRKQMEEALSRLATIVASSPDAIIVSDFHDIIIDWNAGAEQIYGYTAEEIVGKSIFTLIPIDRIEHLKIVLNKLRKGETVNNYETIRLKKNGSTVHVSVSVSAIKNSQGKAIATASIARDITQNKKMEEAVTRLATIVESSPDAIIVTDSNNIITTWSPGAERLYGYNEKEILGKSILLLVPPNRDHEIAENVNLLKKGKTITNFETIRYAKNEQPINISVSVCPIKDSNNNIVAIASIARDITEQKKLEKQRDMLIGVVSHELKTPLTSIKAFVQLLQKRVEIKKDTTTTLYLQKVNNQVNKLNSLILDLLDATKLRAGKLQFHKEYVDINTLIQEVTEDIKQTTTSHTILIKGNIKKHVYMDKNRIGQVITNLLSNAIKYSLDKDKIIVRITTSSTNKVKISVQDFGIGISQQNHEKIFKPFLRIEKLTQEDLPSLGLGLYISREIIRNHNGTMEIKSIEGKGSTFSFTLPIRML